MLAAVKRERRVKAMVTARKEKRKTHTRKNFFLFKKKNKKTIFQLKSLLESKFRTIDDFRVETEKREAEAAAKTAKEKEESKAAA